jgi:hypothetical protein
LQLQHENVFLVELIEGVVFDFTDVVEFGSIDHVGRAAFRCCAIG